MVCPRGMVGGTAAAGGGDAAVLGEQGAGGTPGGGESRLRRELEAAVLPINTVEPGKTASKSILSIRESSL